MRRTGVSIILLLATALFVQGLVFGSANAGTFKVPTTIDNKGVTDVAAKLTAYIASVPDGSTITFPAGSRYRIESIVIVTNRKNLTIDGAGAEFFALTDGSSVPPVGPNDVKLHWPRHRAHFLIVGGSGVTLRWLTIKGANPHPGPDGAAWPVLYEGQHGVDFYGTANATLENCVISDTYGDFVYIGHKATNTHVRGCMMARSGRQGISATNASGVFIDHNYVSEARCTTIDLETDDVSWHVTNVWVVSNTFGRSRLVPIAAAAVGEVSSVVIANNKFVNQPFAIQATSPLSLWPRRHDWYVIGNTGSAKFGSPNAPMWITNTDHVVIKGNSQLLASGRTPTQLQYNTSGSTQLEISGNNFTYAT
jgi:hypothetical protein